MAKITQNNIQPINDRETLADRLENIGRHLSQKWNIYTGCFVTGKPGPFVIDEPKRQELLKDGKSSQLIKQVLLRTQQRWGTEPTYLIKILSSSKKQWPWSNENDEAKAECIFSKTYPAISKHLSPYRDKLKKKVDKGKFWWELKSTNFCPTLHQPKIVYPSVPGVGCFMQAGYDKDGIPTQDYLHSILPADLHLLAILNSKLFNWYARKRFNKPGEKLNLNLSKRNMKKMPIATMTIGQKVSLSALVHRILNDSDHSEVSAIEKEIDQLVYKLYELTPAEIALIEEETSQ